MSRIWNLNPLVNAVVEACAPEEEEEAAEQDSFTEEQIISKAFFGLPFLVKGIPPPPTIGNSFSFGFYSKQLEDPPCNILLRCTLCCRSNLHKGFCRILISTR